MLSPFANRPFRHLFLGQVLSLVGTGAATVALWVLAHELESADANARLFGGAASGPGNPAR